MCASPIDDSIKSNEVFDLLFQARLSTFNLLLCLQNMAPLQLNKIGSLFITIQHQIVTAGKIFVQNSFIVQKVLPDTIPRLVIRYMLNGILTFSIT